MKNLEVTSILGETKTLQDLSAGKDFLVIGLYNMDCEHCIKKSKIFIAENNKKLFQESSICNYVGIMQGELQENSEIREFAEEYGYQFSGDSRTDLTKSEFIRTVFPDMKFFFPTTIIVNKKGDVIKRYNTDLGPQTALAYCQ